MHYRDVLVMYKLMLEPTHLFLAANSELSAHSLFFTSQVAPLWEFGESK